MIHLHILFNSMIQHGYVPQEFLSGVITPIVKDSEGDASSTANYRGLTLSVVFASIFEMALLGRIGHLPMIYSLGTSIETLQRIPCMSYAHV